MWHTNSPVRVLLLCLCSLTCLEIARAQEVLFSPQLKLVGPEDQIVFAFVRYFEDGKAAPTVNMRIMIGQEEPPKELESGYDGIRILVFVPGSKPVTASLMDEESVLAQDTAMGGQFAELRSGAVPSDDNYSPPRLRLVEREEQLVKKFFRALSKADTKSLVADSPNTNIQWQTLNAFAKALDEQLGKLDEESLKLDGWLSWQGNLGARVISGRASFEQGSCLFGLVAIDDELFDLTFDCPEMTADWFSGPTSDEEYIQQAEGLTRAFLSENAAAEDASAEVQNYFAKQYHQSITVERISELKDSLQAKYGKQIKGLRFVKTTISPFNAEANLRSFDVYHLVDFQDGLQCIAQTTFAFSSGKSVVGRGNLASFNVRQSWPSAEPEQATMVTQFLKQCSAGELDLEMFHPKLRAHVDTELLAKYLAEIPKRFGRFDAPDLATWNGNSQRENSFASGNITSTDSSPADTGAVEARFDFFEHKLVSVSLMNKSHILQTRNVLRDPKTPGRLAHSFWSRIFSNDYFDAHSYLSEEFQKQLPRQKLQEMVVASGFAEDSKVRRIEIDSCLISNRIDRIYGISCSVFLVVTFRNGERQPLRCELVPEEDGWGIVDFSSDFGERFVLNRDPEKLRQLVDALNDVDRPGNLLKLMNEGLAKEVEVPILSAFLNQLRSITGGIEFEPEGARMVHEYQGGRRVEFGLALVRTKAPKVEAEPLQLKATFAYGDLTSLEIQDARMSEFASKFDAETYFTQRANDALDAWIKQGDNALKPYLSDSLSSPTAFIDVAEMRGTWLLSFGAYQSVECNAFQFSGPLNVAVEAHLHFEQRVIPLKLEFQFDAFQSRIVSISEIN